MNKRVLKLAPRGKRFGAYCIDKVLPFILTAVLISTISGIFAQSAVLNPYSSYGFGYDYGYGLGGSSWGIAFKVMITVFLLIAYNVVQLIFYTKSQTIGKAILGMQVISSKNGKPIGIWMMILREWFAKKASAAAFCLGYFWILIDDKNRGWHDKIMDSYVIDLKASVELNIEEPMEEQREAYEGGETLE